MTTFATDSNGDLYLTTGGMLAVAAENEAYAHIIEECVRTLPGELQLDLDYGIPYQTTVWEGAREIDDWKVEVRTLVEELDFVVSVVSLAAEFDAAQKRLNYEMTVETDEGLVEIVGAA